MYEINSFFQNSSLRSVCAGSGLVALDCVVDNSSNMTPLLRAGGSCGNVMAILAYLGWDSYPLTRLNHDNVADIIECDLISFGVHTKFLLRENTGSSPIIIHRIGRDKSGRAWHRFERNCLSCGKSLPRFRPLPARSLLNIMPELPSASVFYFDRLSRSTIELARYYKNNGAVIMLEPPSVSDGKYFLEALDFVDILKYADGKRSNSIQQFSDISNVPLEICTLGNAGLKYRTELGRQWQNVRGFHLPQVVDSAGAGDWCSAGILCTLARHGKSAFESILESDIFHDGIRTAQAMGAINCLFPGARGLMYTLSSAVFVNMLSEFIEHLPVDNYLVDILGEHIISNLPTLCPACGCLWPNQSHPADG